MEKTISIDSNYLDGLIRDKFKTQKSFAEAINVTQSKVSRWLKAGAISDSEMLSILMTLNLNTVEEDCLLGRQLTINFRTRNKAVDSDVEKRCKEIARYFLSSPILPEYTLNQKTTFPDINASISGIRKIITGHDENKDVDFPTAYKHLMNFGINVFVLPFQKLNILIPVDSNRRELAFSVQVRDRKIIFLDADRTPTALLFDLVHELAHIFYSPAKRLSYEEMEQHCDQIAEGVIYEKSKVKRFFDTVTSFFNEILASQSDITKDKVIRKVREFIRTTIATELLAWDLEGFFKALESYKIFNSTAKKNVELHRVLMEIHAELVNHYKKNVKRPFHNFDNSNYESILSFFQDLNDDSHFFLSFNILKFDISSGNVNYRFLSELLNINTGDADELIRALNDA